VWPTSRPRRRQLVSRGPPSEQIGVAESAPRENTVEARGGHESFAIERCVRRKATCNPRAAQGFEQLTVLMRLRFRRAAFLCVAVDSIAGQHLE